MRIASDRAFDAAAGPQKHARDGVVCRLILGSGRPARPVWLAFGLIAHQSRSMKFTTSGRLAKELRVEVESDPDWKPFVEHWIREGVAAKDVLQSLYNARFHMLLRQRRAFK